MSDSTTSDWAAFRDEIIELYAPPWHPPKTRSTVRRVLDVLEQLGVREIADLTPELLARFVRRSRLAPSTIQGQFAYVRVVCKILHRTGRLEHDPTRARDRWLPPAAAWYTAPAKHREPEEIRRVLARATQEAQEGGWRERRLEALIYCLAYLGARKSEILGLRRADYDRGLRLVEIAPNACRRLKTARAADQLPVCRTLAQVLDPWASDVASDWLFPTLCKKKPWLTGGPGHRPLDQIRAIGERAGVRRLNFRAFRHTYATQAEGLGLPEAFAQRMLRHTTPLTSRRHYRARVLEHLRDPAERLRY